MRRAPRYLINTITHIYKSRKNMQILVVIPFRFVPFGVVIVVLWAPTLASGGINGEKGGVILLVADTFEVVLVAGRILCCSSVNFDNFCFKTLNSTSFASIVTRFSLYQTTPIFLT